MEIKLSNHNVVITGASTGLGLKTAIKFVEAGANVAICGLNQERLDAAMKQLSQIENGGLVFAYKADISDSEQVTTFLDLVIERFGNITTLINNAAMHGPIALLEKADQLKWEKTIHNNLFAVFYTCRYIIPHFKKNGYGKIINLSGAGEKPLPRFSAYATSKAAIVKFTELIAEENKDENIFINSIAPGPMNTFLLDEVIQAGSEVVGEEVYKKRLHQKESGGTDLDIPASLCLYLASQYGDGITGKLISAVWDEWHEFHTKTELLRNTDIFTMRRVV